MTLALSNLTKEDLVLIKDSLVLLDPIFEDPDDQNVAIDRICDLVHRIELILEALE